MKLAITLSLTALSAAPLFARIGESRDALIARIGKPAVEHSEPSTIMPSLPKPATPVTTPGASPAVEASAPAPAVVTPANLSSTATPPAAPKDAPKVTRSIWQLGETKEFTYIVTFDEFEKSEFERVEINAEEPAKIRDAALNFINSQVEYAKLPENSWKDFNSGDEITFGGRRLTLTPTQNAHLLMGEEKTLLFYERGTATSSPYLWAATEKAFRRDDVTRAPKGKDAAPAPATSPSKVPSF